MKLKSLLSFQSSASYASVEQDAIKISKQLNAEYWAISSKTGENVKAMFFRIAALSFNNYVKKEMQHSESNYKEISSDLVCKYLSHLRVKLLLVVTFF